jgi:hypothetical protein
MPGISIISNFDINQSVPLDSRQVATSSASRDATPYKYEGLKIYQTDTKKTYIWTGITFSIDGSGIYGGSGSLIGDTLVNFGQVGNTVSNKSSQFGYNSTSNTNGIFYTNYFNRHTAAIPGTEWQGIELRNEFRYSTSGGVVNSAYVSFNPADTTNGYGGIAFGTGDGVLNTVGERLRITGNGKVGIKTTSPQYDLDVNGNLRSNNVQINSSLTSSNIFATNVQIDSSLTSSNIFAASSYFLPNSDYKLTSSGSRPILFVGSTGSHIFYVSDSTTFGSGFFTDLYVRGNLEVGKSGFGSTPNQGSITNYEDPTILAPSGPIYYSTNGSWPSSLNYLLSGFTYSFNFYRVGALVNLDFTIKKTGVTPYTTFYGWLIKFNNSRFKATSFNKGSGIGGVDGNALRAPVWCQVIPTGTSDHPTTTGNEFWLKIGTFNTLSNTISATSQGGDFIGSVTDLYFSGTITYISSQSDASQMSLIDTFDGLIQNN